MKFRKLGVAVALAAGTLALSASPALAAEAAPSTSTQASSVAATSYRVGPFASQSECNLTRAAFIFSSNRIEECYSINPGRNVPLKWYFYRVPK